jgi:hypothetical protein
MNHLITPSDFKELQWSCSKGQTGYEFIIDEGKNQYDGFRFTLHNKYDYRFRECHYEIKGRYVGATWPIKSRVECHIKMSVYPSDSNESDGYSYHCQYRSDFYGDYSIDKAERLCYSLTDSMLGRFRDYDSEYWENKNERADYYEYSNLKMNSQYL